MAGHATDDRWKAIDPFFYSRRDAAAQAHQAVLDRHHHAAAAAFGAAGAFGPQVTGRPSPPSTPRSCCWPERPP